MPARIDIPPGIVFGRLTVVEEARLPVGNSTKRAMLCRCECGQQKTVLLEHLRSGASRSCGCARRGVQAEDVARLIPGEVPLYGKRARGRVAIVDIEDYGLVMQHRWHVLEHDPVAPGRRAHGPYAVYDSRQGGIRVAVYMHQLIAGHPRSGRIDHIDGNGLNNRRSNLRPASKQQNGANARKNPGKSSAYKGVFWDHRRSRWVATIMVDGRTQRLGRFGDEQDAAHAYDAAARASFADFALLNFPDAPMEAMRPEWIARQEAEHAVADAEGRRKISESKQEWWRERPLAIHVCRVCGAEFQSNAVRVFYCSRRCKEGAGRARRAG